MKVVERRWCAHLSLMHSATPSPFSASTPATQKSHISQISLSHSPNFLRISPLASANPPHILLRCSSPQQTSQLIEHKSALAEIPEKDEKRRKLCVINLPRSFSAPDIKNLFSQCGHVKHIEIIKAKWGGHRGFAFVTMASSAGARAVIDKFDSRELEGRTIRVEFAKRMKRPSPLPSKVAVVVETLYKLYVSNLAWKVRSSHLRRFFAESYNPASARVVFESAAGRSAGYGFVSFATKEEAVAAISALDGQELMGRPLHLKLSEKNVGQSEDELNEVDSGERQLEEL